MKTSKKESESKIATRATKPVLIEESPPKSRSKASPSRSPGRGRKASPTPRASRKSPSRKSPSRKSPPRKSPSRRSPSRKSPSRKSPSRKSPSRNAKDIEEVSKSPGRRPAIKSENYETFSTKTEVTRTSRPRKISSEKEPKYESASVLNGKEFVKIVQDGLRPRKPKFVVDDSSSKSSGPMSLRSTRLKSATENYEKLLSLAQSTKLPHSDYQFDDFSDSENVSDDDFHVPAKERSATRTLATPLREKSVPKEVKSEFGGLIGVLFQMFFLPLFVLGVNLACNSKQCSFKYLPRLTPLKKLDNWMNIKSLTLYISFILIQVVVSLIPILGKKLNLGGRTFTANGIFSLFVTLMIIFGLEYSDIPAMTLIHVQYIPLLITSVFFGVLLSLVLFIRSRKDTGDERNSFGNSGTLLYDFWMGREVNPCLFGKFHAKLIFMRGALVAAALFNIVSLYHGINIKNFPILSAETAWELGTYKQIVQSISVSPTLAVFTSLQILYFTHAIAREASIVSTFEYQYEGTGMMLALGYSVYPFTTMLITRYVLVHNVVLPNIALGLVVLLYLSGFYIYHASNAQKSAFRNNPLDPKLAHLDSLPTFQGKRLLVSGWWGRVRHPNYLGDILVHLSWAAAALTAPPVLFIVATVFFLAHRAARDGQRCRHRYGAAWDRYCRRVPYNLVPKVF